MISRDRFESCFNLLVRVEARLVHKAVQPLAAELSLDFREDRFNRVEFRRVTDVPNWMHIKFGPPLFDTLLLMDVQIVHEQRNRPLSILGAKLLEVVAEIFAGARLIINPNEPNALLLSHGCDH